MTCIVASYLRSGIVVAADSLSTVHGERFTDGQRTIERGLFSTYVDKIYQCPNGCVLAASGDGTFNSRSLNEHLDIFIQNRIKKDTTPDQLVDEVINRFALFDISSRLIVAGYTHERGAADRYVCMVDVSDGNGAVKKIEPDDVGSLCIGATDVYYRLTHDMHLRENEDYKRMSPPFIPWEQYTLQDAVDFSKFIVETTARMQHFQCQGVGVGGPIDIAVVRPDGVQWLSKKELHV